MRRRKIESLSELRFMGFRVEGLWGLGFRVEGSGFRVEGLGV